MQFTVAARGTRLWQDAAELVARSYAEAFGATSFSKPDRFVTASVHRPGGTEVLACTGLTFGTHRPFFAERYLDAPVETVVSGVFDLPCSRDDLIEVGPLASSGARVAEADHSRLAPEDQSKWGSYYDNAPRTGVMRLDTAAHSFFLDNVGRYRLAKLNLLLPDYDEEAARRVA